MHNKNSSALVILISVIVKAHIVSIQIAARTPHTMYSTRNKVDRTDGRFLLLKHESING